MKYESSPQSPSCGSTLSGEPHNSCCIKSPRNRIQISSIIPEDACPSLNPEKFPMDDVETDSLTQKRNSYSPKGQPNITALNDTKGEISVPPLPLMRRHHSELPRNIHRNADLIQMQKSLEKLSYEVCHQTERKSASFCPDHRSAPVRRIPSRSVSEFVTPLQRSLSRHKSILRRSDEPEN